tara:strand:- start:83 stop:271 length:189 start_codon:yes stop_codon:yes gene_type:complete
MQQLNDKNDMKADRLMDQIRLIKKTMPPPKLEHKKMFGTAPKKANQKKKQKNNISLNIKKKY